MNVDAVLTAPEFAELVPMRRDEAAKVLARAEKGIRWRANTLDVRWEKRNAKRQRVVRVATLPGQLILKFEKKKALPLPGADNPTAPCTQNRAVACPPVSTKQELDFEVLENKWKHASDKLRDRTLNRLRAVNLVEDLHLAGIKVTDAVEQAALKFGVTPASLFAWRSKTIGVPERVRVLVLMDDFGGRTPNIRKVPSAFLRLLSDLYCADTQPDFEQCLRVAMRQARAAEPPINLPETNSVKTIKRHFDRMFPAETQCYWREGEKAWEAKYWFSMNRDRTMLRALQVLNGDGHKLDFMVRFEDGTVGRAMATFWMDLSSNYLFPPHIDKSENMDTVRKSFLNICEQYGVPECVDVDNGMGYAGKDLSGQDRTRRRFKKVKAEAKGIFSLLGIRTIWAEVAHGQSKPIERAFRTLEKILRANPELRPSWCGNKTSMRPDRDIPPMPIEQLRAAVIEAAFEYNDQPGRRSDGIKANGRSYKAIWETKLAEAKALGKPRQLEDWERRYCILPGRVLRIRKTNGGIFTLHGNQYQAHELTAYLGEHIQVRFDPEDLRYARCYTLEGKFICEPKLTTPVAFLETTSIRDQKRAKTESKNAAKKKAEADHRVAVIESRKRSPASVEQPRGGTEQFLRDDRKERADQAAREKAEMDEFDIWQMNGLGKIRIDVGEKELSPAEMYYA